MYLKKVYDSLESIKFLEPTSSMERDEMALGPIANDFFRNYSERLFNAQKRRC